MSLSVFIIMTCDFAHFLCLPNPGQLALWVQEVCIPYLSAVADSRCLIDRDERMGKERQRKKYIECMHFTMLSILAYFILES